MTRCSRVLQCASPALLLLSPARCPLPASIVGGREGQSRLILAAPPSEPSERACRFGRGGQHAHAQAQQGEQCRIYIYICLYIRCNGWDVMCDVSCAHSPAYTLLYNTCSCLLFAPRARAQRTPVRWMALALWHCGTVTNVDE